MKSTTTRSTVRKGAGMRAGRQTLGAGRGGLTALVLALVLTLVLLVFCASTAGAQGVEDWDGVTEPQFDSPETDAANSAITEAQEERDAAKEALDDLDCSLCVEARELDDQSEAASDATRESVAQLVDARARTIEGAPGQGEEELTEKLDALDTLESYAEEWSPGGINEGVASTAEVEAAQAEVQAQLSAVEAESAPEQPTEPTAEETSAAPEQTTEPAAPAPDPEPAGGGDDGGSGGGGDGDDGGGSNEGDGGPLAGLQNLFSGFSLVSLLAAGLIIVGVAYYVIGLLREGLGERTKRVGATQQARAPRPKKPRPKGSPEGGAAGETRQRRGADGPAQERPERPSRKSQKAPTKSPKRPPPDSEDLHGDAGAIADRFGNAGRKKKPTGETDQPDTSAEDLDELFSQDFDDEDDQEDEDDR